MLFYNLILTNKRKIISVLLLIAFSLSAYAQSQRPVLTLPIGHQQPVHTVDFSKDGKLIATGGLDNTFILWDAKTGLLIRRTRTASAIQQVLFTPDGTQLITVIGQSEAKLAATEQPVVQKWDVKTGKLLMKLPFTASPGIQFLPSGYILVPDYSDNLSKNEKSFLQEHDISKYNDAYMDSMIAASDKQSDQQLEKLKFDYSDPEKLKKQQEEYTKAFMEQAMQAIGGNSIAAITKRNITLLDASSFKPVAATTKTPKNLQVLKYNNIEYLVSEYEPVIEIKSTAKKMEALEVKEFMNQYRQKAPIKTTKEFPIKQDINKLATSSEKGFFAIDTSKNVVQLWQIDKPTPAGSFKTKGVFISNFEFSPDGNTLYVFSTNPPIRYIEAWNTSSLRQILSIQLPRHFFGYGIYLAKSGDYFAVANGFGLVKLSLNGDSLTQLHGNWAMPNYYGFSKDDKEVYVAYNVMTNTEKILKESEAAIKENFEKMVEQEAKEENKILTKSEKDRLVKERMPSIAAASSPNLYKGYMLSWDLVHGGAYFSNIDNSPSQHKSVSSDNNYQVINDQYESSYKEGSKEIQKMIEASQQYRTNEQNELLKTFMQMENSPFKENMKGPVTLLINRITKDTVSLIKVDSTDWIMLLKNGYYMTSQNGAKSLSYTRGLDVMPFQQFDLKYNRPDKVLQTIGLADASLIEAYKNAWLKRIKKNSIDTSQFRDEYEVPEADFSNRNKIEHEQKAGKLSLVITANDNKSKLDRFNIWVNEVPVYGKNGKSIKDAQSNKLNTTVEITLSQGKNRIETSVMNANGVESYHVPLFVKYSPDKPVKEITHFIGIGIDQFADNKYNLQYSAKDIRDLSKKLKEKYGDDIIIDTLFNRKCYSQRM